MPGTRTAPTIDGATMTYKVVSVTLYDYTGEQRTDSYQIDADVTPAEIETFVNALQALSNATIWRVRVSDVYNSVGDANNAIEDVWEEASANLVLLAKNDENASIDFYIPAPSNDLMVEGTENIDPTNAALATYLTSCLALKEGYAFVSGRFTSRRDIGTKINF